MRVSANTAADQRRPGRPGRQEAKAMPMVPKLAYRNLFHDRLSLIVTLVGIVFSVVLVAVQFGIYLGSENRIAAMLDHAKGDLWVVPLGTKSFDDPSCCGPREARRSVHARRCQRRGAGRRLRQLAQARGAAPPRRCWSAPRPPPTSTLPWNITQGSIAALSAPIGGRHRRDLFQGARHQQARRPRRDQRHARSPSSP